MQQIYSSGNLLISLIREYANILNKLASNEEFDKSKITIEILKDSVEKFFIFANIWAFGGSLNENKKIEYSDACKQTFKKTYATLPGIWNEIYPAIEGINVNFKKWDEIIPQFTYDEKLS